ncbi:hypothetical protein MUK42_15405 [Musa troglodytarum]|uniref:PRP28/DDX23-like helical domain-containing protein n=1 Tax=Musa troglodytarum TaxID=320322 RepID=A0A9E7IA67_9LILI|nr:hypothetical protein MUK42_15405 [Musa troglodytarum]
MSIGFIGSLDSLSARKNEGTKTSGESPRNFLSPPATSQAIESKSKPHLLLLAGIDDSNEALCRRPRPSESAIGRRRQARLHVQGRAPAARGGRRRAAPSRPRSPPPIPNPPPPPPSDSSHRRDHDHDRDRDRDRDRDCRVRNRERERDKELDAVREQYLEPKKRVIKPCEKFRFSFEWENTEDTFRDINALYQNPHEARLLFGRGFITGSYRREQKKQAALVEQAVGVGHVSGRHQRKQDPREEAILAGEAGGEEKGVALFEVGGVGVGSGVGSYECREAGFGGRGGGRLCACASDEEGAASGRSDRARNHGVGPSHRNVDLAGCESSKRDAETNRRGRREAGVRFFILLQLHGLCWLSIAGIFPTHPDGFRGGSSSRILIDSGSFLCLAFILAGELLVGYRKLKRRRLPWDRVAFIGRRKKEYFFPTRTGKGEARDSWTLLDQGVTHVTEADTGTLAFEQGWGGSNRPDTLYSHLSTTANDVLRSQEMHPSRIPPHLCIIVSLRSPSHRAARSECRKTVAVDLTP